MKMIYRLMMLIFLFMVFVLPQRVAFSMGGSAGLEFSIDAPWRIEPFYITNKGVAVETNLKYGPIPVSITFHDAIFDDHRSPFLNILTNKIHVGTLVEIKVKEIISSNKVMHQTIQPTALREIERKIWISTIDFEPTHELCHPYKGDACESLYKISDTAAWHAMFWYKPRIPFIPGQDIHLEVTVSTKYNGNIRQFTNRLVVHAGEAPLPRFSNRWIYGDFHYHAQMTDNEGESGYSYRNVIRTLGSMGMDFVFATDHASSSEQFDGDITVARSQSIYGPNCIMPTGIIGNPGNSKTCTIFHGREARDLNSERFKAAKNILYGPGGANLDIFQDKASGELANIYSYNVIPQVYMGEEVDAWPEMSITEYQTGNIRYGDGLDYPWADVNGCYRRLKQRGNGGCRKNYSHKISSDPQDGYRVLDSQGANTKPHNSRQHIIYFARNRSTTNSIGFIPSNTFKYGGASRTLEDIVSSIEDKGVAFLAHPLVGHKPGGKRGPDIIPYSRQALNIAWRSPAILGLQFWNEDIHKKATGSPMRSIRASTASSIIANHHYDYDLPWKNSAKGRKFPWVWPYDKNNETDRVVKLFTKLYHGAYTWDLFLRKGLQPSQTRNLKWLPKSEPRKWFMAGGSDSHGDFNFRREGQLEGVAQWNDTPVVDSAIGKPRNLVFIDKSKNEDQVIIGKSKPVKRYSNTEVINVVAKGRFTVTDGPALRIAIDKNRNGRIDLDDYQMGETFHLFPGEHVPLLVEWKSTPEFGPVTKLDVYVGIPERTFAYKRPVNASLSSPLSHGPRVASNIPRESEDAYARDPTGVLRIDPTKAGPNGAYQGVARIYLSPKQYELATAHNKLFYIRAFAQTKGQVSCITNKEPGSCGIRLAYANPIWGKFIKGCMNVNDDLSIDSNNNDKADVCEFELPDPCAKNTKDITRLVIAGTTSTPSSTSFGFVSIKNKLKPKIIASNDKVVIDGEVTGHVKLSPINSCQFFAATDSTPTISDYGNTMPKAKVIIKRTKPSKQVEHKNRGIVSKPIVNDHRKKKSIKVID